MNTTILFPPPLNNEDLEEIIDAKKIFGDSNVCTCRTKVNNDFVFLRYWPFYSQTFYTEFEQDCRNLGITPIVNLESIKYSSNHFYYYPLIKDISIPSFSYDEAISKNFIINFYNPVFIRGEKKSFKNQWGFCKAFDKEQLIANCLYFRPFMDLTGQKEFVIKRYMDFESFGELIKGQPIINEWRFFFAKKMIGKTFSFKYETDITPSDDGALEIAQKCFENLKSINPFVTIDVARLKTGEWLVVEVNDLQYSGLNGLDGGKFYSALFDSLS